MMENHHRRVKDYRLAEITVRYSRDSEIVIVIHDKGNHVKHMTPGIPLNKGWQIPAFQFIMDKLFFGRESHALDVFEDLFPGEAENLACHLLQNRK